jgi:von Willebrand factor type A domain-containing protein
MDLKLSGNGSLRYGRALAVASLVVAIAIGFAISAERSSAQTGPRVILFVVDTSTSMAGKPLTDAKSALKGATPVLPGADVGLRSFGGPCEGPGIERLAIGPFDEPSFNSAVDSLAIGPRGTPTPAALVAAGATLPPEGDRTIVLISDGRSSCGDPCPAAQALKHRLGEGFRIDAVGFRTPDQAESELACVARVTGGTYVSVSDTAALHAALAEASAARVTSLSVSPRGFAAAVKGATVGKVTPRKGAHVLYTVSESAQVRFTVRRARVGRRVRGECRKRTAENRRARRCTRYVRLRGHIVLEAVQGENRFGFRGRWGGKTLRPGRYKLIATAIDASGILGKAKVARFRIVRR